jgi:hypothetical protein
MSAVIQIWQAQDALEEAAIELFERSLTSEGRDRAIIHASQHNDLSELERVIEPEKYAPGFSAFLCYLLWLEGMLNIGVEFELYADEAEGLRLLKKARNDFEIEHPRCFSCGVHQFVRVAKSCHACGQKLRG